MTTPQDLADRLEKAIATIDAPTDKRGQSYRDERDKRFEWLGEELYVLRGEILASLRRSAPASGEMREAVVACLKCGGSGVLYRRDASAVAGIEMVHCRDCCGTGRIVRTPSGETREEAGS